MKRSRFGSRARLRIRARLMAYFTLAVALLLVLLASQPTAIFSAPALDPAAVDEVNDAWQQALEIGVYDYSSDIVQTTWPTPRLKNVGLSSTQRHFYLEGDTNLHEDFLQLALWSDGGNTRGRDNALEIKIEEGKSLGRVANQAWEEMESDGITDLFAPGNDTLAYLNAMRNVARAGEETRAGITFTRYTFEVDGPAFAEYMRDQMQQELARSGELPPSLNLGVADHYVKMTGAGEIWIDTKGLPLRQIVDLEFPPEKGAMERYDAQITTDYSNWGEVERSFFGLPALTQRIDWEYTGTSFGLLAGLMGVMALMVLYSENKKLYKAFVMAMIVSMVVGPLLNSHQVYAFGERQASKAREHEQQREARQAEAEVEAQLAKDPFDPSVDPLVKGQVERELSAVSASDEVLDPLELKARLEKRRHEVEQRRLTTTTSQGDDTSDTDSDGDGLTDDVEVLELDLNHNAIDTDGDLISDKAEVEGFTKDGQQWYLDPNNPDSNGDGRLDGLECTTLVDVEVGEETDTLINPTGTVCEDTDGDGTPDVYDFDDDDDRVPDTLDSAPTTYVGGDRDADNYPTGLEEQILDFKVNDVTSEYPLLVDIQLRPTNPDHLWYNLNVLDWPSDDRDGQITRVHDTTFGDSGTSANGDLRLTPMLEIEIPFQDGHYGNLPVIEGAPEITPTMSLDEWLDWDKVENYGMSVRQKDEDGTLLVYAPLSVIREESDDAPQAFGARIYYQPNNNNNNNNFGDAHQMRLVWLVDAIVDSCNPPDDEDFDTYCEDEENWESSTTVLHTYYEDWYVTGLSVQEEQGIDMAIMSSHFENDENESALWHVADGLQRSFLQARDSDNNGERDLTIAEIQARFDVDSTVYDEDAAERWGIAQDALHVDSYQFDETGELGTVPMTITKQLLSERYPSATDGDSMTLLFVQEEQSRSTALSSESHISGNLLTMDIGSQSVDVLGGMKWAPFKYDGSTEAWESYEIDEYWEALGVALKDVFDDSLGEGTQAGWIVLAQSYYLSLYQGDVSLLEIDESLLEESESSTDSEIASNNPAAVYARITESLLNIIIAQTEILNEKVALSQTLIDSAENGIQPTTYIEPDNFSLSAISEEQQANHLLALAAIQPEQQEVASLNALQGTLQNLSDAVISVNSRLNYIATSENLNLTAVVGTVATVESLSMINSSIKVPASFISLTIYSGKLISAAIKIKRGVLFTKKASKLIETTSKLQRMALKVRNISAKIRKAMVAFTLLLDIVYAAYIFISQVISSGATFGSLAFNELLAQFVATIILAVIIAVLSLATPIGPVIVTIISWLDTLAFIICSFRYDDDEEEPAWCGGASYYVAKAIKFLIYDQTPLVDFDAEDRVSPHNFDQSLEDADLGFSTQANLTLSADVTTNLYMNDPDGLSHVYSTLRFTDSNLHESTFEYELQSSEEDIHESLSKGGTTWEELDDGTLRGTATQASQSVDISLSEAGINVQGAPLYLAEGYAINTSECFLWPFPVFPVCYLREEKDTIHMDLGEALVTFDTFPATLTEFHTLEHVNNSSYKLAWDEKFPVLADADGDGLRSQAEGGNDPNDSSGDYDGDGLSDYWEIENGYNASNADGDADGLNDYWERFYGTNSYQADTDNDGLLDSEEVFHEGSDGWTGGWDFFYASGSKTLVTSDPLLADTDGDGISDKLEQVYGFHPRVPSELNVLAIETQISNPDSTNPNVAAPGHTLTYEATIENLTNARYARGLFETEFEAGSQEIEPQTYILDPEADITMSGSITIDPKITASQATTITTRAGANISSSTDESYGYTAIAPLVYAKFDGNGEDLSGNNYDLSNPAQAASIEQAATIESSGGVWSGKASFDGGTYLSLPNNDETKLDGEYTFAAWLRPGTNDGHWHHVLGGPDRPALFIQDRRVGAGFGWRDQPCQVTSDENVLSSSEWTHVAVTYGAPALHQQADDFLDRRGNSYAFYINGQLQQSLTWHNGSCSRANNKGSYFSVGRANKRAEFNIKSVKLSKHDDFNNAEVELFIFNSIKWKRGRVFEGMTHTLNFTAYLNDLDDDNNNSVENYYDKDSIWVEICEDDDTRSQCDGGDNEIIEKAIYYFQEFSEENKEYYQDRDNRVQMTWSLKNHYYAGDIDELLIYDQSLTAGEVKTLHGSYTRKIELAFDEAPGSDTFADFSGNNHHTDCSSVAACPEAGLVGRANQAVGFDGVDDYLEELMDVTEDTYAASLWFKTDCTDCGIYSVGSAELSQNDRNIFLDNGEVCAEVYQIASSNNQEIICSPLGGLTYSDNEWHHVIHTMNGSNVHRLYVDGLLKGEGSAGYSNFGWQDRIKVGYGRQADNDYFSGLIDHVVILDEYISNESEAADLMREVPVLNLHLDEDLGATTFEDESNYYNNATCSGDACPDAGVVGRMREALFFDGIDDRITIPDDDDLEFDNLSVAFWVKPTQTKDDYLPLLTKDGPIGTLERSYALYLTPDSTGIHFSVTGSSCNNEDIVSSSSNGELLENQWNHVIMTYDGTQLILYINGAKDKSELGSHDSLCNNTHDLQIGDNDRSIPFAGYIDEVAIYGTALDEGDVKALYDYQIEWFDTDVEQLIVIDADEPSVNLERSTSHIVLSDTVMLITANDLTSNIETVEYSIDGGNSWQTPTQDNEVWLFTYQPSAEGEQTIHVRATDSVGHTTTNSTSFTVDGTVPALTLDATLTASTLLADQELDLFGTVTDESSGVNQVYVEIRESSGDTVNGPDLATLQDNSWRINFPLTVPLFGQYRVIVKASDQVGNINEQEYTLLLNGQAPRAEITNTGTYTTSLSGTGDNLPTVGGVVADIPWPNNPLLHLHFEEESGSQLFNDGSGNFQLGTCEDGTCPTLDANGKHGQALAFEGDEVEVSLLDAYSLHQSFTVGAWVKPIRQASDSQYLLNKGSDNQTFAFVMGDNSTQIELTTLANDCSTVEAVSGPTALTENEWNHVMGTFNGESLILYINGVEDVRLDDLSDDRCENSESLMLAKLTDALAYQGSLDEVLIYGRALSADEVNRIANPVSSPVNDVQLTWRHAKGSDLNDALALHVPFEEASDRFFTFRDISSNRLLATCEEDSTCPATGEPGQIGRAASFNNDVVRFAQNARLDGQQTNQLTVAAWVNPQTLSGVRSIVTSARTNSSDGFRFGLNNAGLRFTTYAVKDYNSTEITLTANEWTHVAAVLDADNDVTFYVNGVAEETITHTAPGIVNTDDEFLIGNGIVGLLDEVRVYHRELSADEIEALFEMDGDSVTLAESADYTTWSHQLPANLEGPYRLDMRTMDELGNIRAQSSSWQGNIDTLAPRVTLEVEDLGGGSFRYTTTATDYNLTKDSFNSPCDFEQIDESEYFSESWYTEIFTDIDKLYQVSVSCESASAPNEEATACDLFGNCTTINQSGTTTRRADWQASPAYLVTAGASLALSATESQTLLADGQIPVITLDQSVITSTHVTNAGIIKLTGTVSDTNGIDDVAVTIAPMHGQLLDVRLEGENWSVPWITNRIANLPDGEAYTITVVATDLTGEQGDLTQAVTIDAQAPTSVDVSVSYVDSQGATQPLRAGMTIDDRLQPTLTAEWSASSDGSGLESYLVEWFNEETGEVYASEEVTEPRQASFTTAEAQKVSVRITSRDTYNNQTTDTAGPFYADYVTTPVLNLWNEWGEPYQGWTANSCNLIGTDSRLDEKASALASLNGEQNFYTAWNSEGLRLTWSGADWEQDGDLFIYLDSQAGGSENAYDPYPATQENTIIQLPTYVEGEEANQLQADYLVWVQENDVSVTLTETNRLTATLMAWDEPSQSWQASASEWRYAFNKGQEETDIYLPFSAIGIDGAPASASMKMVALASQEEALKLWATMPNNNNINSEKVFDIDSDAQQVFVLTTSYEWPALAEDVCPSGFLMNSNTRRVQRRDTLQPTGAEVELSVTMDGGGISYALLGDNLMTAQQQLLPNHVNWDPMIDRLCEMGPMHPDCQRPPEEDSDGDLTLDPQQDLPKVMNTTHAALGDGQTISHTLRLVNNGAIDAEGVMIALSTRGRITLPDGEIVNPPGPPGPGGPGDGPESYTQLINLGTIPAGGERTVTVRAVTDFDFDPIHDPKWAKIIGVAYDDRGNEFKNQIELFYMDYELDSKGPRYVGIESPVAVVAPGVNTLTGIVDDRSSVPTIVLEVGLADGNTTQTTCTDAEPANAIWTCEVDLGAVVEGERITIRAKGIDEHGNESQWFDDSAFRVDGQAPTIALSDKSTAALNSGLIGPAETTLTGVLSDNRLVSDVEVCSTTKKGTPSCTLADVELNQESLPETLYLYDDRPSQEVAIDATNACPTQNPLVRTFPVTDTFTVANVQLGLNIEHSYRNDIEVFLRAPSGDEILLIGKAKNANNFDLLFSDSAFSNISRDDSDHNIAAPYYENAGYAAAPLFLFNGQEANGVWELQICDRYPAENDGIYHHARLILTAERVPENTNATWSYRLPVGSGEYNEQALTISALDTMGNRSEPINLNFTVDSTPPTIQATIPLTTSKLYREVDLSGHIEDLSGMASLQLHILDPDHQLSIEDITLDEPTPFSQPAAPRIEGLDYKLFLPFVAGGYATKKDWSYTSTNPFSKVGTHQVWLEGEDNAGNRSRIGPFDINVTAVEKVYLPIMSYFPPDFVATPDAPDLGMGADTVITDTEGGTEIQIFNSGSISITEPFRVDLYFDPTAVPAPTQSWDSLSEYGGYWIIDQPILAGEWITFTLESPFYQADGSNYPSSLEGLSEYYIQLDTQNQVLETHDIEPRLDNYNITRSTWLPDPEEEEQ
ncbi:MAG: LamG-like jellyroll fold domain-containing protein [Ardenticatenaceae bacterium]